MRLIDADAIDYRCDKLCGVSADFIKGIEYMHERITETPTIKLKQEITDESEALK